MCSYTILNIRFGVCGVIEATFGISMANCGKGYRLLLSIYWKLGLTEIVNLEKSGFNLPQTIDHGELLAVRTEIHFVM